MTLHICRTLQLMMPVSAGLSHAMQVLTKQATATFEGRTLTNRAYNGGAGKNLWNLSEAYKPVVKINGLVSGCAVTPGTGNDNAAVAAGVVNVNGVAVTVAADTSNAIALPAAGKYAIYAFSVAADGTTFTVTKGTDGDALDWTAYGGAGQMPLCPASNAVIAYLTRYSNVASPLVSADIYPGESANIAYQIDAVRGNVILPAALPLSYTGAVSRPVYASWYSQDGDVLQPVAETENAKLSVKVGTLNVTPSDAAWDRFEPGRASWTATVSAWKTTDNYLLDKVLNPADAVAFIKARINSDDAYYFLGRTCMTGVDLPLQFGDLKLPFAFQGSGELCRIAG